MGLFSRKEKPPKTDPPQHSSYSTASIHSSGSRGLGNRISASSVATTPLSPKGGAPPFKLPKIDLPRPPDPQLDPAGYLRSLVAVRDRSKIIFDKALRNQLRHFDVDMSKMQDVTTFVCGLIKRDYDVPFTSIPPHGRYQHFCVGGRDRISQLLSTWPEEVDNTERCRRLIDLFLVSVLLDAGAGTEWTYKSNENGRVYRRSEGIAVASLEMFKQGLFSGNPSNRAQVDKEGLKALTVEKMAAGLQSKPGNVMAGLEGRTELLTRLADALDEKKDFFGEDGRPGNMVGEFTSTPLFSTKTDSHL